MLTVLNFIVEHYDEILAIIGGIVSIATIIVKISPSKRDDEILAKRHCFVSLCCRFCTQVVYFCLSRHLFAYKNVSFRQLASNLKIIGRTLMNQILLRYEPRKIYN